MTGPLAGLKVIDQTQALAGPYCTMILGDLGAEVIKLEAPVGDWSRTLRHRPRPSCEPWWVTLVAMAGSGGCRRPPKLV